MFPFHELGLGAALTGSRASNDSRHTHPPAEWVLYREELPTDAFHNAMPSTTAGSRGCAWPCLSAPHLGALATCVGQSAVDSAVWATHHR